MLISKANSDYVPNLSTLAQQKYDLVIGVGFLMAEAMNTVAAQFPDTKFAIIDVDATTLEGQADQRPRPAVQGAGGRLPRRLHGRPLPQGQRRRHRGSVGGQKIPPVDHYIAGYQAGVKAANPDAEVANGYSQKFDDPAPCKELALNQIAEGAKVVFQVAGGCGLGALDAAKEKGVQGIGVDADQAYLGDQIMTSALKKVDVAVFDGDQGASRTARSRAARTRSSTSSPAAWASARPTRPAPSTPAQVQEIQDQDRLRRADRHPRRR